MVEYFFAGLARCGREIEAKGYRRQPLVLVGEDSLSNAERIAFAPALSDWGFVDGLTLSGSLTGAIFATSPLILPIRIAVGTSAEFAPGFIWMNALSLAAIKGKRPASIT